MWLSFLEYWRTTNFRVCSLPFPHKSELSKTRCVVHMLYNWFSWDQPRKYKVKNTLCLHVSSNNYFGMQTMHPWPNATGLGRIKMKRITTFWVSFNILELFKIWTVFHNKFEGLWKIQSAPATGQHHFENVADNVALHRIWNLLLSQLAMLSSLQAS